MSLGNFSVGQRFELNTQKYRVIRVLPDETIVADEMETGHTIEFKLTSLLQHWSTGLLVFGHARPTSERSALALATEQAREDSFRQDFSEDAQHEARCRLVYVKHLQSLPRSAALVPHIAKLWSDKAIWKRGHWPQKGPPHFTRVAQWVRTYEESGRDIRSLVNRRKHMGNRSNRFTPEVEEAMDDVIQTAYLTEERPTMQSAYMALRSKIGRMNMTRIPSQQFGVPSMRSFKRAIHCYSAYDIHRARYGKRAADIRFRVAKEGVPTLRPLARAAMDHCRLDLFVVDDATRFPLGRPWLTLLIDEHTRYVLGYYLGFEEPSSTSMVRALRHAISPKEPSADSRNSWNAWGVMDVLVVDNGNEFHSHALEMGAGRYGIAIEFCPRKSPWYKGKVERFFGTINTGLLSGLKGKTFSSVALRDEYDPAKHAVITLSTLRRVVRKWIVDVYHQTEHRVLKMTPAEAWAEGIGDVDRYLPEASVEMEAAFSKSVRKRLSHKGIEHDRLFYNSADLGEIRNLYGATVDVEVRVCDDDLGHVVVVAPDGKTLLQVPAVKHEYATGLTRWQHRKCKEYRALLREDRGREISVMEARQELLAMIAEDGRLAPRKTRNRQQRFIGDPRPTRVGTSGASSQPADDAQTSRAPREPDREHECVDATPTSAPASEVATGTSIQGVLADDVVPEFTSRRIEKECE